MHSNMHPNVHSNVVSSVSSVLTSGAFTTYQESLLERGGVDLVTGPDAYRDLPRLLGLVGTDGSEKGAGAVNVQVGRLPSLQFRECFRGSACGIILL